MSDLHEEIRQLRADLRELKELDEPTRAELAKLEKRIEDLLDESNTEETESDSVIDQLEEASQNFAAKHPVAESLLRKISYALGRMGI
ncbi:MAG: DUF4404 family protein [Verrucomicrobiota bacterium JB023]|nr:DUF4404 family protein [Verrucomicrobiota bacterium JB023]